MRPLGWMVGVSVLSWLAVTLAAGSRAHPETLLGMLGPLASASATWLAVDRIHATAPDRVMGALIAGFVAKMLFFGVYVAVMLRVLNVRPVPFVIAFTCYFIALYVIEALFLRRLLTETPRSPRR